MSPLKEGNWCYGCGAYEYEPAGETCKNPPWHVPDPKVYGEPTQVSHPARNETDDGKG